MMSLKKLLAVFFVGMLVLAGLGCDREGPAERAGEQVDETMEKAGETVEETGQQAQESMERAGEQAGEQGHE